MDFSDELANLIASPEPQNQSHERSTQSANYDDYRAHTHNIFDISAPTSHHHHSHSHSSSHSHQQHQQQQQQQQQQQSPFGSGGFSLPSSSALAGGLHSPSSLGGPSGGLDFGAHAHFNSTVPAIGSSMRYEPPPHSPFALAAPHEPSSVSSFSSHLSSLSGMSSFSGATAGGGDILAGSRQTPAFSGAGSVGSVGGLGGVVPKDVGVGAKGAQGESPGGDMAVKQALIANEKRRRRRESHNAVERRRRDNINEKISELATLIPECLLDPNATLSMPTSLSAPGEDLLFGASVTTAPADEKAKKEKDAPDGSAEPDDKDAAAEQAGVVKANKGMILRKSVEYIRYLQQLVSAQASRNRDLEQQLHAFRGGAPPAAADARADEDGGLMLHEEVGDFALGLGFGAAPAARGARKKSFHGFELESVEEMDADADADMRDADEDAEMEKSPSAASDEAEGEGEGEEEERGRKGRDGRPVGSLKHGREGSARRVKKEDDGGEGREMEVS
ncbi:HLH-domain-containing protein [Wolfiporia cocos MD-104 SS10]|uniref:HLH-domain-containing protein n=1 Tax=Wolfiporia cocos (strain MD-104) TaxID=742152 RepID=A0A2H3JXI0_WOLCO|nr:HLH-domain-containing protein [Wolfiporia cocos MD-104 SS10]